MAAKGQHSFLRDCSLPHSEKGFPMGLRVCLPLYALLLGYTTMPDFSMGAGDSNSDSYAFVIGIGPNKQFFSADIF